VTVPASTRPARFLAVQLGTDAETVIRWLVALLVMADRPVGGPAYDRGGASRMIRSESPCAREAADGGHGE